jgi:hypothetical protein
LHEAFYCERRKHRTFGLFFRIRTRMSMVRWVDVGVDHGGWGEIVAEVKVVKV